MADTFDSKAIARGYRDAGGRRHVRYIGNGQYDAAPFSDEPEGASRYWEEQIEPLSPEQRAAVLEALADLPPQFG